ncbi:FAD-dependent oxidoreductase [Gordonia spumicola]|uniref:FAD-dependent oxidoreductase n=1 Tax=Gordonia spumicola TaxID=589161 RepID=UPI003530C12D
MDVPPPIGYVESIWADKQWISGCTTANRPGTMLTCWPTIREPIGRLHFAGTETSEHFTGYMEGAVRSGSRAAREVGALLRHNPTV